MRPPLLLAILSAIGCQRSEGLACLETEADVCPDPAEVDLADLYLGADCDDEIVEMLSTEAPEAEPGDLEDGARCCYEVASIDTTPSSECVVGRPFFDHGELVLPLTEEPEDPVAAAWLRVARMELASVAAFARLQLELLAHGAPLDLVAGVAAAMADEVDHAERLRRHAERLVGRRVAFGPMPLPAAIDLARDLPSLAAAAAREGCVGETLSARLVGLAAEAASDPDLHEDLLSIAADEERHAALSWGLVAWAIERGGEPVRAAVAAAFAEGVPVGALVPVNGLEAEGLLGPAAATVLAARTIDEILRPAARVLLAA